MEPRARGRSGSSGVALDGDGDGTPLGSILDEFVARWVRGETPRAEEFLDRLAPERTEEAVELIYREFCMAESAGMHPDPADFLNRFPSRSESLRELFSLHDVVSTDDLRGWAEPVELPESGDSIGPYRLERELGSGSFARVFLARQDDLDDRLVVVKVTVKVTPEPRLLARARHTHIVEVLSHGVIDDGAFQMLVMPFLGGATLSAVLVERRRAGGKPKSGRTLLDDLDRASAPEYPATNQTRPNRDAIARVSYPRAMAGVVARLAEALDHAYLREVAHGDVKPSNVLLTTDGVPMLLDFNLAVGWRPEETKGALSLGGGTFAYMAPERLEAIADPELAITPRAADLHRADVYSLGMLLLEALTGRAPELDRLPDLAQRERAAAYLASRRQGIDALLEHGRGAVPPGLRPILARCLAPHPADRYRRASELAQDLDNWRRDLPAVHAEEAGWHVGLTRWGRRNRTAIALAMLCAAAASSLTAWGVARRSARDRATINLSRYWERADSGVFRFRRFDRWRAVGQGDPAENAWNHLARYGLDEPADWRLNDDVRDLPDELHEDLEVWLLEQALRYGHAVNSRPNNSEDSRRALTVLDRLSASSPLEPLAIQCRLLRDKLKEPPADELPAPAPPPPRWMLEYLLGVEIELDHLRPDDELAHYHKMLEERPRSFWGHYRAATVNYRLGEYSAAVEHLRRCIAQRPGSPALHVQLAGCLYELDLFGEALAACDKALDIDPLRPEPYLSRSFIRLRMGQEDGSQADVVRFETLTRKMGKATLGKARLDRVYPHRTEGGLAPGEAGSDLPRRILDVDPDDVDARAVLAWQLMNAGDRNGALKEWDRVLAANPDHLWARYSRALLRREMALEGGDNDLDFLLNHPRLDEFLKEYPPAVLAFNMKCWIYLHDKDLPGAFRVAEKGLEQAYRFKMLQSESHYSYARVYATAARSSPPLAPMLLHEACEHLRASGLDENPKIRQRFARDKAFRHLRNVLVSPSALGVYRFNLDDF